MAENRATTTALAARLGCSPRTIRAICRRLGVARIGRDYLLTGTEARRIQGALHDGPGRPRKRGR